MISTEPLIVGRAPECGLVIDDPRRRVSKTHFELVATPLGVRIRDLRSKHGTFVDGTLITEGCLRVPCRIQCGDTYLQFVPAGAQRVVAGIDEAVPPLVGRSAAMRPLFQKLRRVAKTELTALILGETGTGKEMVAHALHRASARAHRPFVVIDCASIPPTLAESALFGHEKGAFTGATERRASPFEEAQGGTVFLDEIGELPLDLQPKLLRLLQEKQLKPVGSNTYRTVDVRLIAATRRDLDLALNEESFRTDLYFRLAQVKLEIPPLRQRTDDIPLLIEQIAAELGQPGAPSRITPESLVRLLNHDWPGNVRELKNVITVSLAFAGDTGPIEVEGMSSRRGKPAGGEPPPLYRTAKHEFETDYIRKLFAFCGNNISEMYRVSGIDRSTIKAHLQRLGLHEK